MKKKLPDNFWIYLIKSLYIILIMVGIAMWYHRIYHGQTSDGDEIFCILAMIGAYSFIEWIINSSKMADEKEERFSSISNKLEKILEQNTNIIHNIRENTDSSSNVSDNKFNLSQNQKTQELNNKITELKKSNDDLEKTLCLFISKCHEIYISKEDGELYGRLVKSEDEDIFYLFDENNNQINELNLDPYLVLNMIVGLSDKCNINFNI